MEAKKQFEITLNLDNARRIWVRSGDALWVYDAAGETESHDPMDRVGGPYHITSFVDEDTGNSKWFLFWVVDCYFPCADLVNADSFEDAFEIYIEWAAEHRHIKIEPEDEKDYYENPDDPNSEFRGNFTSNGVCVDTDDIQGHEVQLVRVDTTDWRE